MSPVGGFGLLPHSATPGSLSSGIATYATVTYPPSAGTCAHHRLEPPLTVTRSPSFWQSTSIAVGPGSVRTTGDDR
jgi:hypothetical protein